MITKEDILKFSETHRVLVCAKDFIYLLPHPKLRNWISNYTITFPGKSMISDNYTVIPHGSATLVFSFDGSALYSNLFGPSSKPCMVGSHANQFDMLFIIEFQPAGLYAFTGDKQKELADQTIAFELVNAKLNTSLAQTLYSARNMNELITHLDHLLLSNLHGVCPCELSLATQLIIDNMGNISSKELSGCVYYSERHLSRIFDQCMGMSVKSFSRLVRINKTIRLLHNPRHSITYACHSTGYYDLSHFIHDFTSACGITPQEYRSNMSDFYSQIAKF